MTREVKQVSEMNEGELRDYRTFIEFIVGGLSSRGEAAIVRGDWEVATQVRDRLDIMDECCTETFGKDEEVSRNIESVAFGYGSGHYHRGAASFL